MTDGQPILRDKLFINDHWVSPTTTETIEVHNAGTGAVMGTVPAGDAKDIDVAVAAARAAFDDWSQTPVAKRAEYLARISAGLQTRAQQIIVTIAQETGMPVRMAARPQVAAPIAIFGSYAKTICNFQFEERVGNSLVLRVPVGVVGVIIPWNYPLWIAAQSVAAALAAGCTVVLKPSEIAPFSVFMLADVIEEVGLPKGVFNLVTGYGPIVGEALVRHPEVDAISFTGSPRTGRRISELAAPTLKRVMLELGGKSASIILDDADLAVAINETIASCYQNSGQTCLALTRMLVPESKYDEACAVAAEIAKAYQAGDPLSESTTLGPVASLVQLERVRSYIKKGIEERAQLITGGPDAPEGLSGGYFVKPTVFGRVDPRSTIAQEEIFGPVLSIITYNSEEDAVRIANDTVYGLSGAVWSKDEERAKKVARKMHTGQVSINGGPFNLGAPFGGVKQSGHGREGGKYGLEEFLEYKSLQLKN
jgi:acyl-CoA reductase-like NAD-dependent aldehyde dehydrogenase